ncbi:hypothetical protein AVEN_177613-1 [Araneus ventricosus]|uniref:Uncharacterized protein n=1 Tax=Araneus ventricosus TaxID=182803 RepID=A0A4Y2EK99_ARAVE|nr:hypothetical protein AVEN_177613-1 [Araneus ventricosus]
MSRATFELPLQTSTPAEEHLTLDSFNVHQTLLHDGSTMQWGLAPPTTKPRLCHEAIAVLVKIERKSSLAKPLNNYGNTVDQWRIQDLGLGVGGLRFYSHDNKNLKEYYNTFDNLTKKHDEITSTNMVLTVSTLRIRVE